MGVFPQCPLFFNKIQQAVNSVWFWTPVGAEQKCRSIAMEKIYDVVILGAGPAGLAAGIYAGRARLSVLIVEKAQDGGQIAITAEI